MESQCRATRNIAFESAPMLEGIIASEQFVNPPVRGQRDPNSLGRVPQSLFDDSGSDRLLSACWPRLAEQPLVPLAMVEALKLRLGADG